jgi:hypothetical protein
MYEVDSHYLIGIRHINSGKPCQDHALSGLLDGGAAFAIAADGCSSGRHTDMGARLMTFATARAIRAQWTMTQKSVGDQTPDEIAFYQRVGIDGVKTTLGLNLQDLLATCVYAFVSPEGGFIHVQGDGVFAYKLRSGEIVMSRFDWQNNAPCYPAYAADNYASYINAQGGKVDVLALTPENWQLSPKGDLTELRQEKISLGNGIRGITKRFTAKELAEIEYIAVFSDGVTQIENLEWQKAVSQLLAFKTTAGEFATRRLIRAVKDAEQLGKGPIDDIAYAVIKIPSPQPNHSNAN